jgi:glycosyltransferase involved in cell wall biosynthesis
VSAAPRIVVVSPYGREYGPPRTLEHVARAIRLSGYEPVCVVPRGATVTPKLQEMEPEIHRIERLSTIPRTGNPRRLAAFIDDHLAAADRIVEIAQSHGAAAIYSTSEAIFCGGIAARRLKIPSMAHVIGMSIASPRWGAAVYIRLLRSLNDTFVACSSAVADMLESSGVEDDRITVVHNGIEIAEIDEALAAGGSPVNGSGPRIGMFAAYDSRKGHELFVEAAARVARERPDARFFLVGAVLEGQAESDAFEQRVTRMVDSLGLGSRFVRPGYVPVPEVYRWIEAMDVIVVPSKTEAFAHALLEAMACRRAVVATAIEGNLDAFVDGHSGVYVPRNGAALARAITSLLADPDRRERLGAAARRRVELLFDINVTLSCLADAVEAALDGSTPARAAA